MKVGLSFCMMDASGERMAKTAVNLTQGHLHACRRHKGRETTKAPLFEVGGPGLGGWPGKVGTKRGGSASLEACSSGPAAARASGRGERFQVGQARRGDVKAGRRGGL